jgi:hypothetical protein
LYPPEDTVYRLRQALGQHGLAYPRCVLYEDMPLTQKRCDGQLYSPALANDHFLYVVSDSLGDILNLTLIHMSYLLFLL